MAGTVKSSDYPGIEPGTLRHQILIQSPSTTQDATGQPTSAGWTNVLTTYASIEAITAREQYQNGQFTAQGTHVIKFRFNPVNITPSMRVKFGNRIFKIQNVDNVQERNILIKLTCLAINEGSNPGSAPC